MQSGLMALTQAVGWLHVLVALAGVVVCAMNLGRSRWVVVLLGGFCADALVSAAYRVSNLLVTGGQLTYSQLGGLYLLLSFLGIMGSAAIVGGLALLLGERAAKPPAPGPADGP
jgi:hypothetical protein